MNNMKIVNQNVYIRLTIQVFYLSQVRKDMGFLRYLAIYQTHSIKCMLLPMKVTRREKLRQVGDMMRRELAILWQNETQFLTMDSLHISCLPDKYVNIHQLL